MPAGIPAIASVAALACFLAAAGARAGEIARVIDADTLQVGGRTVRLSGVIAPGPEQGCRAGEAVWHCGREAAEALLARIAERPVRCVASGDEVGRERCFSEGVELNRWLVRAGWAMADGPRYQTEQTQAVASEDGIWRGGFSPPSAWIEWAKDGPSSLGADSCDVCSARKRQWTKP